MNEYAFTDKFQTLDQMLRQQQITELLLDRWGNYDQIETVKMLPSLDYFRGVQVWLGTWSRTAPNWKEKYILSEAAYRPSPDAPKLATPSELARSWVDVAIEKQPRANSKQFDFWRSLDHFPPQLAIRGFYQDYTYLDLKSAYWSIMQVVGWGAEYHEKLILRRYPVNDFPYNGIKMARNSLATVCLPTVSRIWYDGQIIERKGKRIVNNGLFYLLQDILQAVAWDMVEYNPVYINTDGYIIPSYYVGSAIEKIENEWGLLLTPKHKGNARIFGIGSYSIGAHRTVNINMQARSRAYLNNKIPMAMIKRHFRFLSERFPPVYS